MPWLFAAEQICGVPNVRSDRFERLYMDAPNLARLFFA
jgi:hypothetical protein